MLEFELATPGAATLTFLGQLAKPLLGALALRASPLPAAAKVALGAGASGLVLVIARAFWRRA